jgi:inositol phosphorylceramide mannosyltransferase catalytic subunit
MIIKKFDSKKFYNFGCVISTYNRQQILEKTLDSLLKTYIPKDILFVFIDDCSIYENYVEINYDHVYFKKSKNYGIANSLAIGWDFIYKLKIPYMLNLDSDVLLSENWLSKILNTHQLFDEKTITTGFNGFNHNILEKKENYFLKNSIGGINLFFNRSLYPTVRKSLTSLQSMPDLESGVAESYGLNPKLHPKYSGWDWGLMVLCDEEKIKRVCTNPSVIQHIGNFGLTSSPKKFEKSMDFKNECVPKIIHQMWMDERIPPHLKLMQNSVLKNHPEYKHRLWTDEKIDCFILQNYPHLYEFYNSFEYIIQKIDFARLLIVYHFGGVYLDLDTYCYQNLNCILNKPISLVKTKKHSMFTDYYPLILNNAFVSAEKNNLFLKTAINNIIKYKDPLDYKKYCKGNTVYAKILKSAGPLMITETYMNYNFKEMINLLDNDFYYGVEKTNDTDHAIFSLIKKHSNNNISFLHIHESSWWKKDGKSVLPTKNPKKLDAKTKDLLL